MTAPRSEHTPGIAEAVVHLRDLHARRVFSSKAQRAVGAMLLHYDAIMANDPENDADSARDLRALNAVLLAALEAFVERAEWCAKSDMAYHAEAAMIFRERVDAARAAIARAEGGTR